MYQETKSNGKELGPTSNYILKNVYIVYMRLILILINLSESSREWNSISEDQKDEIGLVREADGEFWQHYNFKNFFIRDFQNYEK